MIRIILAMLLSSVGLRAYDSGSYALTTLCITGLIALFMIAVSLKKDTP